ncbi:MAG: protein DA1 [Proteobacteria bacterium]|nr:MAG: protein DA1 [Pseudomonadota bacterium]RZA25434.1 MAG: protein DA1 [Pseudomonadota bacterium]
MRIKTVTILGRKIPVTHTAPKDDSIGEFTNMPIGIRVNDNLEGSDYRRVLIHECVHAALAISGIAGYQISEEVEESICTVMESAFEDILKSLSK